MPPPCDRFPTARAVVSFALRGILLGIFVLGTFGRPAPAAELVVEIQEPREGLLLTHLEDSVEVIGGASVFGGVRFLDLFLVIDTSKSLVRTDPQDFRRSGAIGLVEDLPPRDDIRIGVIGFSRKAELLQGLTPERSRVLDTLHGLGRAGLTKLGDGILRALDELDSSGRPEASRVILVFTDGKTNEETARRATEEAARRGVAVHAVLLGSDPEGTRILGDIAHGTGGTFVRVDDPRELPQAFMSLRTTGVERVELQVEGAAPVPARLAGGTFIGRVPVRPGRNRIVARATSLDGEQKTAEVTVVVSGPLSVTIDSPSDGTLLRRRETGTIVTGRASTFANLPASAAEGSEIPEPGHGVREVALTVNGSAPVAASLTGGIFRAEVPLTPGENRIVATALSDDGRSARDTVTITVRPPGCAELRVTAKRNGRPALSISDRAVEIVFDASNSMWGRMEGEPKITVAKRVLAETLDWMPEDLAVALRVYGHQHKRELRNCTDSQLLFPFGPTERASLRAAIEGFKPRGQTPLAYSLERVAADFGDVVGERAVVLVTDGIESCGGDPAGAARRLQQDGPLPVHVIGFGLGSRDDADPASLRAIAEASGGRFVAARSAQELRRALAVTVGTTFRVLRGTRVVARGSLGSEERIRLPEGDYRVRVDSAPPQEVAVRLTSEERTDLVFRREGGRSAAPETHREAADYATCELPASLEGS